MSDRKYIVTVYFFFFYKLPLLFHNINFKFYINGYKIILPLFEPEISLILEVASVYLFCKSSGTFSISYIILSFEIFVVSVIFSPEEGLLKKYFDNLTTQKRLEEYIIMDILNSEIIDCKEKNINEVISYSLKWKLMRVSYIMNKLKSENKIEIVQDKVQLTEEGKDILNRFLAAQHCFY